MYEDKDNNRILMRDGTTVVSSFEYARRLHRETLGEHVKCLSDRDSELYEYINSESITYDESTEEPKPHKTTEFSKDEIESMIKEYPRYIDSDDFNKRLKTELDFFTKYDKLDFIADLMALIIRFKEDGIIWGVGRGSSCSSLIMYIIEVNDINPLEYNIPFSEMSKEEE
jgi:DNA polymerase III alpha subunit